MGALREQIAILEMRVVSRGRDHFLRRVKDMRRARNLTQAEPGRLAGVSDNTIYEIEKGKGEPSDPNNDFIGILLTQRLMDSPEPPAVFYDFQPQPQIER